MMTSFPSPYGVIYLITIDDMAYDISGMTFPSPYGVIYLITELTIALEA